MSEYISAMKGVNAINQQRESEISGGLTDSDVDDLKAFLEEKG